jgi:hypothetical protein
MFQKLAHRLRLLALSFARDDEETLAGAIAHFSRSAFNRTCRGILGGLAQKQIAIVVADGDRRRLVEYYFTIQEGQGFSHYVTEVGKHFTANIEIQLLWIFFAAHVPPFT